MGTILDGKKIAEEILIVLKARVAKLSFKPVFCDIVVGEDPASLSYVKIKGKAAEDLGIEFKLVSLPVSISQEELVRHVRELNTLENLCGLIVQLPLPPHLDRQVVLDAIDPKLDVDCLGSENTEKFYAGKDVFVPPTAAAVMEFVKRLPTALQQGDFVVLGRGQLVGKPVTYLLERGGKAVQIVSRSTENFADSLLSADVLICGAGQAGLVTGAMVKEGAAIIDAGTSEMDGSIAGDVDFESASSVAGYITPVPGGVGPVTVAKLLENVVQVAETK